MNNAKLNNNHAQATTTSLEECTQCGRPMDLGITDPRDLVYRQDILEERGWTNKRGYWYCPECSSGTGR